MRLKAYAAKTHQGPYLQVNEDGYEFDFENDLFMLFDGFGGSGIGDKAIEKLKLDIRTFYTQISDDPNATMPIYYNPRNLLEGNAIINSMLNAHQKLYQANQDQDLNHRAGASALIAVRADSVVVLVGVGNCRAYHFRQGKLVQIMLEDTLQLLGKDHGEAKFRNTPMSAFGMYPELSYQMREVRLSPGDKIIALTDGVYAHLSEDELVYALNKAAPDAQERVNALLKLSNSRGNLDNQSAMILEF